tara:strand:+ start:44 stop:496 length:453 start_codon:yes stop_codon:yes gene_type:complete
MWNLLEDLKYGKMREKIVICFLNKDIFKDDRLKLYSNEMKQVDFRNQEIVGELKSRTNKHNTYETTFFGYNKIKYLIEEKDKRVWKFYFLFTDGLYVWTYNKDQYEIRDYEHRERGLIHQVYVPIIYLEKISSSITSNSWLPDDWEEYIS